VVEALCYKPEGRGIDSRWCHWEFFINVRNSSGRTMALESTQPLTEMSTRNIYLGGKSGWCVGITTLPLNVPIVLKSGSLNLLES
jgi:hypothetical protein